MEKNVFFLLLLTIAISGCASGFDIKIAKMDSFYATPAQIRENSEALKKVAKLPNPKFYASKAKLEAPNARTNATTDSRRKGDYSQFIVSQDIENDNEQRCAQETQP